MWRMLLTVKLADIEVLACPWSEVVNGSGTCRQFDGLVLRQPPEFQRHFVGRRAVEQRALAEVDEESERETTTTTNK